MFSAIKVSDGISARLCPKPANNQKNNNIMVEWNVANEMNLNRYEIDKNCEYVSGNFFYNCCDRWW